MQEKVDYEGLMNLLIDLNYAIHEAKEDIRMDCASLSINLNEFGLQGLATSTIDSTFSDMRDYFNSAHNYVAELVNWVNTNVIGEYQSADANINYQFKQALNAEGNSRVISGGYYPLDQTTNGPNFNRVKNAMKEQMYNYGNDL